jgi:hypothetical protein
VGDDWEHPLLSVDTCLEAIKQLSAPQQCVLCDEDVDRIGRKILALLLRGIE